MITNSNPIGSSQTVNNAPLRPRRNPSEAPPPAESDSLSTTNATRLQAALAKTPILRSEVVARASALAADPSYPSAEIIGKIGRLLARSKDLSLQED